MSRRLTNLFPLIMDIESDYRVYRRRGLNREQAIEKIISENAVDDMDDGPQVWIALADVTGKKHEMTEDLYARAERAFSDLLQSLPVTAPELDVSFLNAEREAICNRELIGGEAKYSIKREFKPDWQVGDTFYRKLTGEYVAGYGLDGWYLIFRKTDEVQQHDGDWSQLGYFALCPPGPLPTTVDEINKLGYLQSSGFANWSPYPYLVDLSVPSKKKLAFYEFTLLGNFPDAFDPPNMNPTQKGYVFPVLRKPYGSDIVLNGLEDFVCNNYRHFGLKYIPNE